MELSIGSGERGPGFLRIGFAISSPMLSSQNCESCDRIECHSGCLSWIRLGRPKKSHLNVVLIVDIPECHPVSWFADPSVLPCAIVQRLDDCAPPLEVQADAREPA